ncbi:hypothetical protein ACFFSW_18300 [Saccharothrix longispora]|uniref:Uncharacterized protein n=1 Tax=Saccharothrix longispora TaxID=33920 RepID=A0ABU1PS55_9PSEU|nr:hypothetical protein [Saccharothrix longispora]MDR6593464.1 hypothetical protein [Saccharothrix longispora]
MAADRSGTTGGEALDVTVPPVSLPDTTPVPRGTGEPLTVDTDKLRAAAARYGVQAGVFHALAETFSFLLKPPIKRTMDEAMGDETVEKFVPAYLETTNLILTGIQNIGNALHGIADGVGLLAQGHEKTEDNNIQIARGALISPATSGTSAPDVSQGAVVPGTTGEPVPPPPSPTTGPQRKGVVHGRGATDQRDWSGIGIPSTPQELVNAHGEKIGVLAPLGADVPGGGERLVLTGADGRSKGFFQSYGEHTLDEAVEGELRPGVLAPFAPSREEPPVEPGEEMGPVSFPSEVWAATPPGEGDLSTPLPGAGVETFPAVEGVPVTPPEEGLWEPATESDVFAATQGVPASRADDSDS